MSFTNLAHLGFSDYSLSECNTIVRKDSNGRILKIGTNKCGYNTVNLVRDHDRFEKKMRFHRLVALTRIPNPNNLPVVNHKDMNTTNNHVDNLEWTTAKENAKHAWRNAPHKRYCYSCEELEIFDASAMDMIDLLEDRGYPDANVRMIYYASTVTPTYMGLKFSRREI